MSPLFSLTRGAVASASLARSRLARSVSESDARFPRPLFFFQGSPTEGRAFLRRYWPGARAIADPELVLYDLCGIERGSLFEALGPKVLAARSRAKAKGLSNGPRSGDIWRMPGMFLSEGERIVWAHDYAHAADHPDYDDVRALAAALPG